MKMISVRKVAALVFALFVTGGSLASAGGAVYFGERYVAPVTVSGGAVYFGE